MRSFDEKLVDSALASLSLFNEYVKYAEDDRSIFFWESFYANAVI